MKKFFLTVLLGCSLSAFATDPYFSQATAHVDFGGEALQYQNMSILTAELNSALPELCAAIAKNEKSARLANDVAITLLKLLDLPSIRAIANSSKQVEPGTFICKQAIIFAPDTKSLLTTPGAQNRILNWQSLPADTLGAFEADLDLPYAWNRIKSELAASDNPDFKKLVAKIAELKNNGTDIDAVFNSIKGRLSLLVTGKTMQNLNFKLEIPDQNGLLSASLKNMFPPKAGSNVFEMPQSNGVIQVIYAEKSIIVVSDPQLLAPPAQALGALPQFRKYAKYLPQSGEGYVIVNMSQETVNFIKSANQELPFALKPFTFIAVGSKIQSGEKITIASDFSLLRLQIMGPLMQIKALKKAGVFNK
ncbi:MAG: hypothetical protein E7041_07135 [Lentisphaerae bacterium]|nr:hypothetical protein [Lentisphaerota bacterium]